MLETSMAWGVGQVMFECQYCGEEATALCGECDACRECCNCGDDDDFDADELGEDPND